jgi:hypothetical protein
MERAWWSWPRGRDRITVIDSAWDVLDDEEGKFHIDACTPLLYPTSSLGGL